MDWLRRLFGWNRPDPEEKPRATQLRELYGFDFPPELFEFWRWYHGLDDDDRGTLGQVLGIGLVGPFDVLAGRFDDVELVYPAVLHWRYGGDPAEFVTVFSGDTDGLHWGYWFDHHGVLEPVVAAYYARDAFELWHAGDTLFDAVRNHLASRIEGAEENLEYDPDEAAYYRGEIAQLKKLAQALPGPSRRAKRTPTHATPEGMGIVAGRGPTEAVDALLRGKQLWFDGQPEAFDVLIDAYEALDRPVLAAIARAHEANPRLPRVDILQYEAGHCDDLDKARKAPATVRELDLVNRGLTELPELAGFTRLEVLKLQSNQLTGLPPSLGTCERLRVLNLWNNQVTELPDAVTTLPALEELKLGQNPIARLPETIGQCRKLRVLELLSSHLTELPPSIGQLSELTVLNLAGSQLTELPASVGRLTHLTRLSLHKNQLTDLPDLSGLTALTDLGLTGNPLPDEVVERVRAQVPQANVAF